MKISFFFVSEMLPFFVYKMAVTWNALANGMHSGSRLNLGKLIFLLAKLDLPPEVSVDNCFKWPFGSAQKRLLLNAQ